MTATPPSTGDRMSTALHASPPDALAQFLDARPRLFGIACRILRNGTDAEDLVQDVWLRWQAADRRVVRDAPAFLAATATRLAINVLRSARARRETQAAPWTSEPVDPNLAPGEALERHEALAHGVRVLLEALSPTERAAYILREAFSYAYRDIAGALGLGEANARQVVTRARRRLAQGRRTIAGPDEHRRLLEALRSAADGHADGLADLVASMSGRRDRTHAASPSHRACHEPPPHPVVADGGVEFTHLY
jgi:RNA polymerase sigma-70 factor (ECF subfamily)